MKKKHEDLTMMTSLSGTPFSGAPPAPEFDIGILNSDNVEALYGAYEATKLSFDTYQMVQGMLSQNIYKTAWNALEIAWEAADLPQISDMIAERVIGQMRENEMSQIAEAFSHSLEAGTGLLSSLAEPLQNSLIEGLKEKHGNDTSINMSSVKAYLTQMDELSMSELAMKVEKDIEFEEDMKMGLAAF